MGLGGSPYKFDFQFERNGIVRGQWSRVKVKAYRGVSADGSGTGMSLYTQGLYSATKRSVAQQYGVVRQVSYEDLPVLPLRIRNYAWFDYLVNNVLQPQYVSFTGKPFSFDYVRPILQEMGYDGLVIGLLSDCIIVKW